MKKENAYDFRQKLLEVHAPSICDSKREIPEGYIEIKNGAVIECPPDAGEVITAAAEDLKEFLSVSMGIEGVRITAGTEPDGYTFRLFPIEKENSPLLGDADKYKGYFIKADSRIGIYAHDERGMAQAIYYLEDEMAFLKLPAIKRGEVRKWAAFSPQMVHSGFGIDDYPDRYLSRIAHEGRDAVIVNVTEAERTPEGFGKYNGIIRRAARFGIDVYAYSAYKNQKAPDDEGAEEYYDGTYGKLFKECPGFKGIILVGESVEFPSKDPHISNIGSEKSADGIPTGALTSGYYPCCDYPEWLETVSRAIRKHKKDADIVFWTYNWGYQPEEARIALINRLPKDITLLATFEMFEAVEIENTRLVCSDYTLCFEGPGGYFKSEAEAAKKNGIKLYAMTNTAGLTWDIGTIPYEPMAYQWIKRYEKMYEAKEKWGLSGIMESHHYGLYPSFISRISHKAFTEPHEDFKKTAERELIRTFGEENLEYTKEAQRLWSEAIRHITPTYADQYGAFRVGPVYPFWLEYSAPIPAERSNWTTPVYHIGAWENDPLPSVRIYDEIKSLEKMRELTEKGIGILEKAPGGNEELDLLINLGKYIKRTVETGIRAKKWHILKCRLFAEREKDNIKNILCDMEKLLLEERENAEKTIPLLEADSRLGWEPSMLYIGGKKNIGWKLRQIDYVLTHEIPIYKKALEK